MTYWYLTTDTMPFYVSIWSLKGTENYRFYGVVFGMVGGMHGVRLLDLIVMSIRGRQLTLWSETSVIRTLMSNPTISKHLSLANKIGAKASQSSRQPKSRLASLVARSLAQMWKRVFSRQGFFGVESAHFSTVYALQELLVTSSQTYQTYRASNLLSRSELNVTMVALLVTNCWTTAGFQIFLRKSPELGRVFTFTYDAMVGFAMVTVVPLLIFVPYIQAFDLQYKIFKNPNFIYDPVPFVTMVLENRLMFAASMLDFATKLIPHLSLMLSLVTVSELLGRGDVKVVPGPGGPRMQLKFESTAVKPKQSSIIRKPTSTDTLTPATKSRSPNQWKSVHALLRWKHAITVAVFLCGGAVVLLLHVRAIQREANNEVLGCRARTRPWFSNGKEPCASLVYDCHAHNTTSPNQASFDKLDPVVLATLSIAHCAGLEMPPSFQRLERLMSLHIYNSTIVKWDTKSSISATAHPRLLSVLVGRTQMSEVPQGILQPLPASVICIQFSHTNLKALPNDLSLRWHPLLAISFENSELADIPFQMFLSPAQMLSLVGNQIETIPSLAMLPAGVIIQMLELTNNPIKELPATLKEPTALIISMSVQHTSLTNMPEWVKTNTKVVWAYGTPFCATPMADPTFAERVMCFERPAGQDITFPMFLFDALYAYEG
ncbi:hypothetical protein PF005_g16535 [Phytophthora fragariae]|uniref:Uncharacterized protein n=1 Tax=Phytophthora fragariae TaxID=53985 RepID=A0A6A3TCU2_9STRA|nr:hypothetical protein PF003_g33803 [Phytophthora fragariae]KAE9097339.1 hypothetical protein PF007_g16653 [Phytophthora fragariae]KAE9131633.1 hypothetical protein PF006_g15456 [Phytophthora fragariae]KAE9137342.1 hypothetical protein PF010_g1367 [Phytophthora fragariae]KAE9197361.1 hypothetical protein PF005_g16535 [Phytophthora fragariae]